MKKERLLKGITGIIAALFFYAALSKLEKFSLFRHEMLIQVFPKTIALILVWIIPLTEWVLVCLLMYLPARLKAFYASLVLLSLFTFYIAIVMTGLFGRVPCGCGGILKNMGYGTHLIFNLFFILLAIMGIGIEKGWITSKLLTTKRKEFAGN